MRPDKKKKDNYKGKKQNDAPTQKVNPEVRVDPLTDTPEIQGPQPVVVPSKAKVVEEKPPKNISSNWTQFEIPSDDETDESSMTGISFQFALENVVGSSSQLRMKSELEWDSMTSDFTSQFFTLDLKAIGEAISCIPMQNQLEILPGECNEATINRLTEDAIRNKKSFHEASEKVDEITESLNQKLIGKLLKGEIQDESKDDEFEDDLEKLLLQTTLSQFPLTENKPERVESEKETKNLEDWLDDFLDD